MRLVDADALKDWLEIVPLTGDGGVDINDLVEHIDLMPAAQPEIIRCKDCKWFGEIGCAIEIVDDSDRPSENDFCSFAERRTDG